MNRLQNLSELKRDIAAANLPPEQQRAFYSVIDRVQREIEYTQANVPASGAQKGDLQVRVAGDVRVKLKWPVETTDYKITATLLTRDPETFVLSEAVATPLYDKRYKDSFVVNCSMSGSLKWRIEPF